DLRRAPLLARGEGAREVPPFAARTRAEGRARPPASCGRACEAAAAAAGRAGASPPVNLDRLTFRAATPADAPRLAENLAAAFDGYREFAGASFRPPAAAVEATRIEERLRQSDTWVMLADDGAALAGHVGFLPAATSRR